MDISTYVLPRALLDRHPRIYALPQWNGSWPIHLTKDSSPSEIRIPSLDTDRHHLHHLGGRAFMAAVSPWFFTVSFKLRLIKLDAKLICFQHYGPDSWNKNASGLSATYMKWTS